mgnify:CR=1 FL=1
MQYPTHLLPNQNYKLIDCDLSKFYLIRHSHIPQDKLLDDLGNLKTEAIAQGAIKIIPDYSTSLFSVFETSDIYIKVINKNYQVYCKPNEVIDTPVYDKDFILNENRGYWLVKIEKINNQKIKYEDGSLSAICVVIHTPMKWNFWHFSIRWYINDIDGFLHENPDYETKSVRRKLTNEARSLLKEYGSTRIFSDDVIEKDCYIV